VINFCANNYLGLANHPELIAAAKAAWTATVSVWPPCALSAAQDSHKALEKKLADFLGMEDAILLLLLRRQRRPV
jgi:glycine C-acetyltransferase